MVIQNLGHGRVRPEVLRNRYFYMMAVIICVHKLYSQMFYSAGLGEIHFSIRNPSGIPVQEHFSKYYVLKFQFVGFCHCFQELYSDSFSGCPGSDKYQHRKWPLAHERPRVTQKFPSGVIL